MTSQSVRMLNPGPLCVWLLTGALVRISVVPGATKLPMFCRKAGSIEMLCTSAFRSGGFRPTAAVEIQSSLPLEPRVESAEYA